MAGKETLMNKTLKKKSLIATTLLATAGLLAMPLAADAAGNGNGAGGVSPGAAFYVDGALYRTVATPTDLSHTGAPDHSFDTIYGIADQMNVATAAPGDQDYNGGRWRVVPLTFDDYEAAVDAVDANGNDVLDSAEEVHAAIDLGLAERAGTGPSFVCPVIPLPGN